MSITIVVPPFNQSTESRLIWGIFEGTVIPTIESSEKKLAEPIASDMRGSVREMDEECIKKFRRLLVEYQQIYMWCSTYRYSTESALEIFQLRKDVKAEWRTSLNDLQSRIEVLSEKIPLHLTKNGFKIHYDLEGRLKLP